MTPDINCWHYLLLLLIVKIWYIYGNILMSFTSLFQIFLCLSHKLRPAPEVLELIWRPESCGSKLQASFHCSLSEIMLCSCVGFIIKPSAHFIKSSLSQSGKWDASRDLHGHKNGRLLQFCIFYSGRDAFKYVFMRSPPFLEDIIQQF